MAKRLIGSGVTDSNGVVSIPYTGTGKGKLQIVAESGTLISEPYEFIDATMNQTGKTTGWYQSTVTLENNRLKWIYKSSGYDTTSSQFVGLRSNALNNALKGTTFKVDFKLNQSSSKPVGLAVYYQDASSSYDWVNVSLLVVTDTLEHSVTSTIPSTSTNIWIRLQTSQNSLSDGDITYIDKFVVYPI